MRALILFIAFFSVDEYALQTRHTCGQVMQGCLFITQPTATQNILAAIVQAIQCKHQAVVGHFLPLGFLQIFSKI